MKPKISLKSRLMSCLLILALVLWSPINSVAQSNMSKSNLLERGTLVTLAVTETFKADDSIERGTIRSIVDADVYSADGSRILIKAGTPALIECDSEPNGSWGKAGKMCVTSASTKTIDGKNVILSLSKCKKGSSKVGGVIVISVLLFPIGLLSGFWKGGMPKINSGTHFNTTVMQDIVVE